MMLGGGMVGGDPSGGSPRTPRSKPRGVRKKWGFPFGGSKSGSLKSIKSNKSGNSNEGVGGSTDNLTSTGQQETKDHSRFGDLKVFPKAKMASNRIERE